MEPPVVTITLSPAIDHTVLLGGLRAGSVNRCESHHRHAGGKGVNVSAMLADYGIPTIATGLLGRDNPRLFEKLFAERHVSDAFVRIAGETRTGIKIVETGIRRTTDLNFPGLKPLPEDLARLTDTISQLVVPGRWFVLGGSLPAGIDTGFFAGLISRIRKGGGLLAVDTSGEALRVAIEAGVDLIKPNEHELAEYLGRPLADLASKIEAASRLHREHVTRVILSLGDQGALFVDPEAQLMAAAPPAEVTSTVGAGDALLAGYLAGLLTNLPPAERARLAATFAWSAMECVSRQLPSSVVLKDRMRGIRIAAPGAEDCCG